jgi:hypothetical protein
LEGTFFDEVVISAIAVLTSSIRFDRTDTTFYTAWVDPLAAIICNVLLDIRLRNAANSWCIPSNKSVALLTM